LQNETCLKLDWDYPIPKAWVRRWKLYKTAMLEGMGYKVKRVTIKPSPSKKGGKHVWIAITPSPENDMEKLFLEWLLGDQQTRVWINMLRIKRGVKKWDKLFTRHLWIKPIPRKCKKCNIRKIREEQTKIEMENHPNSYS